MEDIKLPKWKRYSLAMKQASWKRSSSAPIRLLVALGLMAALLGALLVNLEPANANSACNVPPAGLETALGEGGESVILTWKASRCAPDMYAVYRRNMDQAGERMQLYATVDGTSLAYTDSRVIAGNTYRYPGQVQQHRDEIGLRGGSDPGPERPGRRQSRRRRAGVPIRTGDHAIPG